MGPLELCNELFEYQFNMNLSYLNDYTIEFFNLMVNKYRVMLQKEPSYLEIKVQNLLDKSQARINAGNQKNYMSYSCQQS